LNLEIKSRLYSLLTAVLTPIVLFRLAMRGVKAPAYFRRWRERFGVFPKPNIEKSILIHAVSVGEVNAAIPLIKALMETYKDYDFVITTVTPTGSDRVQQIFGNQVFHLYLPYDLPGAVKRFLKKIKPHLAVVMETEIWPNLFRFCQKKGIPIVVANARLSELSLKGYKWVQSLARMAVNNTKYVAAQTNTDAERMIRLGCDADKIYVVGSLKFDIIIEDDIREKGKTISNHFKKDRLIWIAASTHQDDEKELIGAYIHLKQKYPQLLLIVVPRHPERFQITTQAFKSKGFNTQLRSECQLCDEDADVFIVDSMGEMLEFYAASDIAFVGGSIANIGGHNVLEAAVFELPVLVGPNTHNFAEITQLLHDCGGSKLVRTADDIIIYMQSLIENPEVREQMGKAAFELVQKNRGAVQLTMKLIENALNQSPLSDELKRRRYIDKVKRS
jgi:3-deoxy-D-manno-octulosonic-acid transferase